MILLDTNVISELIKAEPDRGVLAYVDRIDPDVLFTAAICEAEIRYGLARMPPGRRLDGLAARIATFFDTGFHDRVLSFDRLCAACYGDIRFQREAAGRPISIEDAMIAATARAYGVGALVTRNTEDFLNCGVPLINPWLPV